MKRKPTIPATRSVRRGKRTGPDPRGGTGPASVIQRLLLLPGAGIVLVVGTWLGLRDPTAREALADVALPLGMVVGLGDFRVQSRAVRVVLGHETLHRRALRQRH